ncbi:MAG: heavy-metal-associated domain-containing protein [Clostridiales bacterium]|nr:heavy-metal-associated domain-containing protein [Clostridiales bacterium]
MIKTTIGVQGMACNMCENHVNDAVRNTVKCKKVTSDHKKGITEVISAEPIDEEAVRNAITKDGYEVTSFESAPYEKKGLFGFGR